MSVPPPSRHAPAPELELPLDGRKRADRDSLRLTRRGLVIEHGRLLAAPLELPLGLVKVASVDPGPARVATATGRFPVLRRLTATTVIPRTEGIEGWLWTSTGGSGLTQLGDDGEAPNVALVLAKPLDTALLRAAFEPRFLSLVAARSPLGTPAVLGLLLRVLDAGGAERGFRRWGFPDVLSDREVPPTLRRHLPGDRPADRALRGAHDARAATSVAPPGMA